jgi:hypothetical protein
MVAKNQSSNQNDMHVMGGQITESYPKDKEYPAETCPAVGAAGRVRKVTGTPTPSSLSLEAWPARWLVFPIQSAAMILMSFNILYDTKQYIIDVDDQFASTESKRVEGKDRWRM